MQTEIPGWVLTGVGLAGWVQIFSGIALAICGAIVAVIAWNMLGTLKEIRSMVENEVRKDLLPSVTNTMKNVEKISADAAETTHNVTGTVNKVSNVVSAATTKLESPIIKVVGIVSGIAAASRGAKKAGGGEGKKKRGFFG